MALKIIAKLTLSLISASLAQKTVNGFKLTGRWEP